MQLFNNCNTQAIVGASGMLIWLNLAIWGKLMPSRLGDFAKISLGRFFRRGLTTAPNLPKQGRLVVQPRDLTEFGLDLENATTTTENIREKFALKKGDVLFQPRGVTYRAAAVDKTIDNTYVAAPLFIISPDPQRLDPSYLVYLLNDSETQATLRRMAKGSSLPFISRDDLETLTLPMPSLARQTSIGEVARLLCEKKKLGHRIDAQYLLLLRAKSTETEASATQKRSSIQMQLAGLERESNALKNTIEDRLSNL